MLSRKSIALAGLGVVSVVGTTALTLIPVSYPTRVILASNGDQCWTPGVSLTMIKNHHHNPLAYGTATVAYKAQPRKLARCTQHSSNQTNSTDTVTMIYRADEAFLIAGWCVASLWGGSLYLGHFIDADSLYNGRRSTFDPHHIRCISDVLWS